MSEQLRQYEKWKAANGRLMAGVSAQPARKSLERLIEQRRTIKAVRAPRHRWERLFTRAIDELDKFGNIVIAGFEMPAWKRIALEVCADRQVSFNEMLSHRRDKSVVAARHEAMWRCKNETQMSFPDIGRRFGGRDHTTILYAVRSHEKRLSTMVNERLRARADAGVRDEAREMEQTK